MKNIVDLKNWKKQKESPSFDLTKWSHKRSKCFLLYPDFIFPRIIPEKWAEQIDLKVVTVKCTCGTEAIIDIPFIDPTNHIYGFLFGRCEQCNSNLPVLYKKNENF